MMTPTARAVQSALSAAFFAFSGIAAEAATVADDYSSFWVLGDSLSDNGNVFAITGTPTAPYVNGQFSNGPVWAELVGAQFLAQSKFYGNVAYGGAKALLDGDLSPDLPVQLGFFGTSSTGLLGARPLVSLWFGGNDLLAAIGTPDSATTAAAAANAVADTIDFLTLGGVGDFLVMNLPDLGATPRYGLLDPVNAADASLATKIYNDTLSARVNAAAANVTLIDTATAFAEIAADPSKFGLGNTTLPCVYPTDAVAAAFGEARVCSDTEAAARAFFDPIHPNAGAHAVIADLVTETLAPTVVPLPAGAPLLLLGVSGLALLRRRT